MISFLQNTAEDVKATFTWTNADIIINWTIRAKIWLDFDPNVIV